MRIARYPKNVSRPALPDRSEEGDSSCMRLSVDGVQSRQEAIAVGVSTYVGRKRARRDVVAVAAFDVGDI